LGAIAYGCARFPAYRRYAKDAKPRDQISN